MNAHHNPSPYAKRLAQALKLDSFRTYEEQSDAISDLAHAMGVVKWTVEKLLSGGTLTFNSSNNAKAAQFLGVSPHWLATGEGEMKGTAPAPALAEGEQELLDAYRAMADAARETLLSTARMLAKASPAELPATGVETEKLVKSKLSRRKSYM